MRVVLLKYFKRKLYYFTFPFNVIINSSQIAKHLLFMKRTSQDQPNENQANLLKKTSPDLVKQ